MTFRRARLVLFALLLTAFSANYFFWAAWVTAGVPGPEIIRRYPSLSVFPVISQYLRVYDSPYFFSSRNIVTLSYTDGHTASEILTYDSFRNPLDFLCFFHAWYWWTTKTPAVSAQKDRLLRSRFCQPGVKSAEWKIYYVEDSLTIDLGRTDC